MKLTEEQLKNLSPETISQINQINKKEKRFIARIIAIYSALTIASTSLLGYGVYEIIKESKNNEALALEQTELTAKYNNILDQFEMSSDEYKEQFNQYKQSLINQLTQNIISANSYEKEMDYLNSNDYTKDVLFGTSNNQEIKNEIATLTSNLNDIKSKRNSIGAEVKSGFCTAAGFMTTVVTATNWHCDYKNKKANTKKSIESLLEEDKKKKEEEKIKPLHLV